MKTKPAVRRAVNTPLQSSVIVYLVLLMFGLPLIVTDGYFNITETKSVYFHIISIALICCAVVFTAKSRKKKKNQDGVSLLERAELCPSDTAMLVFCGAVFISAVLSPYPQAWTGITSRYQGFFTLLVYVAVYFIISRNFTAAQSFLLFSMLSFSLVCLTGVFNCFDIDVLGIYGEIAPKYKTSFISTIGNINFYSSYLCLLMPLVVCGFCLSTGKISRAVYTVALTAGSFGMMVTSSESFVVGFSAALMIMPMFFYNRLHRFRRYLIAIIIIVCSSQVYMVIYRLYAKGNVAISKLLGIFVNPFVAAVIICMCLVMYFVSVKAPMKIKIIKKVYPVCLCVFIMTVGVMFVVANTVGIDRFNGIFKITSEWGTYRGKIWRFCAKTYLNDYNIIEKLFGTGPETLNKITASAKLFERKSLDQAHNEYLQYLMTTGLIGVSAYLGVIGTTIYTVIKKLKESTFAVALLTGLVAYWMQATVNIAQPFTTPIVYIYIACIAGMARNVDKSK